MVIPDFQTIMLPLMRHLQDGREHATGETIDALAKHFQLTDAERSALLPSGLQEFYTNKYISRIEKVLFAA
jgi:restriction system protein